MKRLVCIALGCLVLLSSINAKAERIPIERFLSPECVKRYLAVDKQLIEKWEVPYDSKKYLQFFDNGLMTAEFAEKRYYLWDKDAEKNLLKITFCDSREKTMYQMETLNMGRTVIANDERTNTITYAVVNVDKVSKTVFYSIYNNSISFEGWMLYKQK